MSLKKNLENFHYGDKLSFKKEVRNINETSNNSIQCIDGKTLSREMVTVFDRKY